MNYLFPFLLLVTVQLKSQFLDIPNIIQNAGCISCDERQVGTGTLILYEDHLYLLSAKHVLESCNEGVLVYQSHLSGRPRGEVSPLVVNVKSALTDGSYLYASDKDVALVEIGLVENSENLSSSKIVYNTHTDGIGNKAVFESGFFLELDSLYIGMKGMTIGFPGELYSNNSAVKFNLPLLQKGSLSGFTNDDRIIAQLEVYGGNSGGPFCVLKESFGKKNGAIFIRSQYFLAGIIVEFIPYIDGSLSKRGTGIQITSHSGYAIVEPMNSVIELLEKRHSKR